MKITKKWLKEKSACSDGIQWFLNQKETNGFDVLQALIKADKLQWANWLICRLMDKPNCVRYAIFAAEQVLSIYEKRKPKDNRPRKAIEAARSWLDNPNDRTKAAAAAAYAADAAAAADYAADAAAARKKLQIKVLEYGIKLLEKIKDQDLAHTPTLGESLDHYSEAYCTRAVNCHEELLKVLKETKTMTNELLRTMDAEHYYHDDLVALQVKVILAITKAEGR